MSEVTKGRGYVYSLQYHIVWCVKYRHEILKGNVRNEFIKIIKQIAEDNEIEIVALNTDKDHVHMLIDCKPQHYIPSIVKAFKGVSARLLLKHCPELKEKLWGGHLWNPSYFVATVSENTEKQIQEYIESQTPKEGRNGNKNSQAKDYKSE